MDHALFCWLFLSGIPAPAMVFYTLRASAGGSAAG